MELCLGVGFRRVPGRVSQGGVYFVVRARVKPFLVVTPHLISMRTVNVGYLSVNDGYLSVNDGYLSVNDGYLSVHVGYLSVHVGCLTVNVSYLEVDVLPFRC